MLKKNTILFCGVASLMALVTGPALSETLDESVRAAIYKHPQVESAMAALRSTEAGQDEAFSGYFPTLSVTGTVGRMFGDNATSRGLSVTRGDGYSNLWEGSFTARQPIYDGMETRNRVKAASSDNKAAVESLTDVRETLALRTVQTYIELMRIYRGLAMLNGQQKSVKDYLAQIKDMTEQGVADEAEYQQAIDVSVILDNFIVDYEGQARRLEADYKELTGFAPEGELTLPKSLLDGIPANAEEALQLAKSSHPLIKSAQFETASAKHGIAAEKASIIPNVDGELSYLRSEKEDIIGGEVIDARAVLRMNWNFETGGAQLARIKQRTYEHQQALSRVHEIERGLERAIQQAYADLDTAKRQLENQKKRHALNEKLYETYKTQFEGALISVLQLMQSDNQVLITDLDRMNAEMRLLSAQYGILASMGQLQKTLGLKTASVMTESQGKK